MGLFQFAPIYCLILQRKKRHETVRHETRDDRSPKSRVPSQNTEIIKYQI